MTGILPSPADLPSVIETDRLLLRPWETSDAVELQIALAESVDHLHPWVPWASSKPNTLDHARGLLAGWIRDFEARRSRIYAVLDRSDSALNGGIGLYPRVGPGALEIGYWIRRTRIGRGFATEASRALTQVGFLHPGISRLEMHVDPTNHPSFRIPEKLGYRRLETRRGEGNDARETAVFVVNREEHKAGRGAS